jgi:hypothetical protein
LLPPQYLDGDGSRAVLHAQFSTRPGLPDPSPDPTVKDRAKQLIGRKKVLHTPAIQFKGKWKDVAPQICEQWFESQVAHSADKVSVVALAKMKALEYEYKYVDKNKRQLLAKSAKKKDYHNAMVRAFLEAMGEDPDKVMASFKKAGMGALHRKHVTWTSVLSGISRSLQNLLSLNPIAKLVFTCVQALIGFGIAIVTYLSGARRFENSPTEEMLVLGRVDASPTAKAGPDVLKAAWGLRDLRDAARNLRQMNKTLVALNHAVERDRAGSTPDTQNAIKDAEKQWKIAFAKFCSQAKLKSHFKAASDTQKVEFRGNRRYLYTSYAGTVLTVAAGILLVFTPGAVATAVTGGAFAVAAALSALLYLGYQLSTGPSKDGVSKAKRAIVAFGKSADLMDPDVTELQQKFAHAHNKYEKACKKAEWMVGQNRKNAEGEAMTTLLDELDKLTDKLAKLDRKKSKFQPAENWKAYAAYELKRKKLHEEVRREPWKIEEVTQKLADLEVKFSNAVKTHFDIKTAAKAWKTPLRMRFDGASKLLAGDVAHSQRRLIRQERRVQVARQKHCPPERLQPLEAERLRRKQKLENDLLDMLNLELALQHMQLAISGSSRSSPITTKRAMQRASLALGAIKNPHVYSLFCGDAQTQVKALAAAKERAVGEKERYVFTNAGASLPGIIADSIISPAVSLRNIAINVEASTHGKPPLHLHYTDQALLGLGQRGTAPFTASYTAADRTPFQKNSMGWIVDATSSKGKPKELPLTVPKKGYLDRNDPQVAILLDKLSNLERVADAIEVNFPRTPTPSAPKDKSFKIALSGTRDYYKHQFERAQANQKATSIGKAALVVGKQAITSSLLLNFLAERIATLAMKIAPEVSNEGNLLLEEARKIFTQTATRVEKRPRHDGMSASEAG